MKNHYNSTMRRLSRLNDSSEFLHDDLEPLSGDEEICAETPINEPKYGNEDEEDIPVYKFCLIF